MTLSVLENVPCVPARVKTGAVSVSGDLGLETQNNVPGWSFWEGIWVVWHPKRWGLSAESSAANLPGQRDLSGCMKQCSLGIRKDEVGNKGGKNLRRRVFWKRKNSSNFSVLTAAFPAFVHSFRAVSGNSWQASSSTDRSPSRKQACARRNTFVSRHTPIITFSTARIHPAVDCRMRPLEIPWKKCLFFFLSYCF